MINTRGIYTLESLTCILEVIIFSGTATVLMTVRHQYMYMYRSLVKEGPCMGGAPQAC